MAQTTKIGWTGATWNIVNGCSVLTPGCIHCYAMRLAGSRMKNHPSRIGLTKPSKAGPVWTGETRLYEPWLDQPYRWKKPKVIFVCAHGDLFHESVSFGDIMRVFKVMADNQQHIFQVLTKRSKRMRQFLTMWCDTVAEDFGEFKDARGPDAVRQAHKSGRGTLFAEYVEALGEKPEGAAYPTFDWAEGMMWWPDTIPNIHWGVSAEDQKRANERVTDLITSPGMYKRFVSAEPLLAGIDFTAIEARQNFFINALMDNDSYDAPISAWKKIDQIIVGGESGPNARYMQESWPRMIRDDCEAFDTKFFFKQWGAQRAGNTLDGRIHEEMIEA